MIYLIGLIGIIIGLFSPAAGILYLIPTVGVYFIEKKQKESSFFIGWLFGCGILYSLNIIDKIQVLNLVFGTGLSCILLFYMIKREFLINTIYMSLLLLNSGYIAIRQILFSEYIFERYAQAVDEAMKILSNRFPEGSEQYSLFLEMIEMTKNFYQKYSPGIWILTMMFCLIVGYYILSKKYNALETLRNYQTHRYIIYSLILALMIAVLSPMYKGEPTFIMGKVQTSAINYLFAMTPLFFLQGLGVLKMKIGRWIISSKILLFLAVLTVIINPYVVLFISVIGLFDNWFDFRNLSQTEDVNENHSD